MQKTINFYVLYMCYTLHSSHPNNKNQLNIILNKKKMS